MTIEEKITTLQNEIFIAETNLKNNINDFDLSSMLPEVLTSSNDTLIQSGRSSSNSNSILNIASHYLLSNNKIINVILKYFHYIKIAIKAMR